MQKCFAYALNQNKGNPDGVRNAILNIVPHVYGEHGQCGDWCKFQKDPSAKYKSLPRGLALEGDSLRQALNNVFGIYAQNAEKLAPCGSTLANESFNNSIASKAPKARHYRGSESLDFRVKAAACQKNIGHSYVSEVGLINWIIIVVIMSFEHQLRTSRKSQRPTIKNDMKTLQ